MKNVKKCSARPNTTVELRVNDRPDGVDMRGRIVLKNNGHAFIHKFRIIDQFKHKFIWKNKAAHSNLMTRGTVETLSSVSSD
jgi:hypothetical protein